MTTLLIGLGLFLSSHLIPTSDNLKSTLLNRLGTIGYRVVFSIISLVSLALIVWGFGELQGDSALLWEPPSWARHVTFLFMLPVFPLLVQSMLPGQMKKKVPHPMLMAVKIWAFAHLIANGDLASVVMFGTFLIYGVYALISAKKRQRAGLLDVEVGPARNDIISLVLGLAIYVGFILWLHPLLIGVPVVAM